MANPSYFISCDWGTSNFRLRLVETGSLSVLVEHKTDQGIKVLYQKFLEQNKLGQTEYFLTYLQDQIDKMGNTQGAQNVVTVGMASANIGLLELEYGNMPFDEAGKGINFKAIPLKNGMEVLLVSGIKDESGMMRGEEIQALGLTKYLESYKNGMLILPGTHSKHINYDSGEFTALKSFMTGELFELLSTKSILANNVETCQWITKRKNAFKEGLSIGFEGQLSAHLFSIRAKNLLHGAKKKDNYFTLSGMLIGDELSYLKNWEDNIFLAAPEPFFDMYKLALETILRKEQLFFFGDKVLENALLNGQKKILHLYENK